MGGGETERLCAGQVVESGGQFKVKELVGRQWRRMGGSVAKRSWHICVALDGKLWVVGGMGADRR